MVHWTKMMVWFWGGRVAHSLYYWTLIWIESYPLIIFMLKFQPAAP